MVELTQYAMDAMGLSDDSRVTFNQILKYRDQLTSEFNASVQEGLADLGVSDPEGVTFTLADFAFAIAANHEKLDTVSLTSQINYLGQARGDQLFAEARCDKSGRTTCLYTIRVTDQEGRLVAQVATTGFITG